MTDKPYWKDEQRPGDWITEPFRPCEPPFRPEPKEESRDAATNVERRVFTSDEVRAEQGANGEKHLTGYAIRFNRLSSILKSGRVGKFRERVLPGATRNIAKGGYRGVMALWNHNPDFPLGSSDNGSLQLAEDAKGLRYSIRVDPNVSYANDLWQNCRSGTVTGASFGFAALDPNGTDDDWRMEKREDFEDELDDDELDAEDRSKTCVIRSIRNIRKLLDVSPCSFAAYKSASVEARSQNIVIANAPEELIYRREADPSEDEWLAQARRRADAVAKLIEGERDAEEQAQQRRNLFIS